MALRDLSILQSQLLTSGLQNSNPPLYQVIKELINAFKQLQTDLAAISGGGGGGGSVGPQGLRGLMGPPGRKGNDGGTKYIMISNPTTSDSDLEDHVVMSDGVTPIPSPVDDGAGNFIYIPYIP